MEIGYVLAIIAIIVFLIGKFLIGFAIGAAARMAEYILTGK